LTIISRKDGALKGLEKGSSCHSCEISALNPGSRQPVFSIFQSSIIGILYQSTIIFLGLKKWKNSWIAY
jgi:hypothetical protein